MDSRNGGVATGRGIVGDDLYGKLNSASLACEPPRTTPLSRLENALNRLAATTNNTISNAQALTGGWAQSPSATEDKKRDRAGVFGAIDEIVDAIHVQCDRMNDANAAVQDRLP